MTDHQSAYRFILDTIERADNYFAFGCVDKLLEHWTSCYPELRKQKSELIDARCDKWVSVFQRNHIQIKNQNNDHASTT